MKRFYVILPALLGSVAMAFAQKGPYTYGVVPLEQLNMKQYENDTTANAVVLYEYGNSVIERDRMGEIKLFYTYKARVKIFKKEAFDKATYRIPLAKSPESRDKEKLVYAKAIALNEYEAPVALKEKDVFTENYSERFDVAKFTIPNVVEGTVFDVEYQTVSPFMYNFQEWRFQDDIPKAHSEYHTSIPGNYQYHIKLVGYLELDDHTGSVKKG
ncbi:MAG: hypothetical protein KDD04_08970, partial [Sinomicrobium sp.]|nr:hypothetical protein [Sinomicrobium sp.]